MSGRGATSATPVKPGTRYARRRRAGIADGTWQGRTSPDPAFAHITYLRSRGLSIRAIAAAADLPATTVTPIAYPDHYGREFILGVTAEAILRVTPEMAPDWACVYAIGSRRRLEALMRLGWSGVYLGQRLGMTHQAIHSIRTRADRITAANARRIAALFDELEMHEGPSVQTRTRAERAGYPLPLAWDIDTIDDPAAVPAVLGVTESRRRDRGEVDEVAVQRAVTHGATRRDLTIAERHLTIAALAARGWSDTAIGEHLGVTARTVERDRREADIESRWSA